MCYPDMGSRTLGRTIRLLNYVMHLKSPALWGDPAHIWVSMCLSSFLASQIPIVTTLYITCPASTYTHIQEASLVCITKDWIHAQARSSAAFFFMLIFGSKLGTLFHVLRVIAKVTPLFDFHVGPLICLRYHALLTELTTGLFMLVCSTPSSLPSMSHSTIFAALKALARKFHCIFLFEVTVF